MAGTVKPIAALTAEDRGPINTIVSIFLPTATILLTGVRILVRRRKTLRLELGDVVFGVALLFGVSTSVISHLCVTAGLGRHQAKLTSEQIERYSKLFWASQFTSIIAMACAKLSIILLFKRIDPNETGPRTVKWLLPMNAIYTILSLFLIAFQCQLPRPWDLSLATCSTHGRVYYPITISNMLTDTVIAFWMFPVLCSLRMRKHTRNVVMCLFGSRFVICAVDMGRMYIIHNALQTEDRTRSQLLWAIMDQIIVHVSINHATLPRIQMFLSDLQTGVIGLRITVAEASTENSKTPKSNSIPIISSNGIRQREERFDRRRKRRTLEKAWEALHNSLNGSAQKAPSISEQPLKFQPEQGIELSTTVYTGSADSSQKDARENASPATQGDRSAHTSTVRVDTELRLSYDKS